MAGSEGRGNGGPKQDGLILRNNHIRGTEHVRCLRDKAREARLRWSGLDQERYSEYYGVERC